MAVALTLITRALWKTGLDGPPLIETALATLLAIRPQALPNRLVLLLGLRLVVPHGLAANLRDAFLADTRILANRERAGLSVPWPGPLTS